MVPKFQTYKLLQMIAAGIMETVSHATNNTLRPFKLTKVAAQVHADTMPDAIKPGFTDRLALLNSSELVGENPV